MMADSLRVFVQMTQAKASSELTPPAMAFVTSADPWLVVLNEFVMSCQDDELEVSQRPPGFLEAIRIVDATNFAEITQSSQFEDGKSYLLCRNAQEFGFFSKTSAESTDDPLSAEAGRGSIVPNNTLESLEELSYYFDDFGTLRHCATNQPVYELMRDESRACELDDIVKAAIFHIQMEMLAELSFQQVHVPLNASANDARSQVFLTSDWKTNANLVVVINGGRGVQPGIWSRDLLIQEGMELGSMLPTFRRARRHGFAIAVLNPFTNNVTLPNGQVVSIRHNSSPDDHVVYVWDHILQRATAQNLFILAFSFGAKLVTTLLQQREAQVVQQLRGVVFAEAAYHMDPVSLSPMVGQFLKLRAINFKADPQVQVGHHLPKAEQELSCSCLSVGTFADAMPSSNPHTVASRNKSSGSKRSSSNKARTISLCLETTFSYFNAVRDRGVTAAEFISESETKTHSWLGNMIRSRLDSLKPRRHNTSSSRHPRPPTGRNSTAQRSKDDSLADASAMRSSGSFRGRTSSSGSGGSGASSLSSTVSVNDFELIKVIGKGSIGKVFLVRKVDTNVVYAMKVLRKSNVLRHGLREHIQTERLILEEIDHPFIARLRFSFQTKDKLYLVTDYCSGGELFHHMSDHGFSYELAQFYAAELVLALDHLHSLNVAYRDLKPENILVEASGHLRITDFGLSKLNVVSDEGAQTLVGSAEYLAPEVYNMEKYGFAVDWWSLGVFLYEMLTGVHPFFDENRELMVKKITNPNIMHEIMPSSMPPAAASIIFGLLCFNPAERLGSRGAQEIQRHLFFENMDWKALMAREITPPWKPVVQGDLDVGNFDTEFTSQPVVDSVATAHSVMLSETFANFTFDPTRSSKSIVATGSSRR